MNLLSIKKLPVVPVVALSLGLATLAGIACSLGEPKTNKIEPAPYSLEGQQVLGKKYFPRTSSGNDLMAATLGSNAFCVGEPMVVSAEVTPTAFANGRYDVRLSAKGPGGQPLYAGVGPVATWTNNRFSDGPRQFSMGNGPDKTGGQYTGPVKDGKFTINAVISPQSGAGRINLETVVTAGENCPK